MVAFLRAWVFGSRVLAFSLSCTGTERKDRSGLRKRYSEESTYMMHPSHFGSRYSSGQACRLVCRQLDMGSFCSGFDAARSLALFFPPRWQSEWQEGGGELATKIMCKITHLIMYNTWSPLFKSWLTKCLFSATCCTCLPQDWNRWGIAGLANGSMFERSYDRSSQLLKPSNFMWHL